MTVAWSEFQMHAASWRSAILRSGLSPYLALAAKGSDQSMTVMRMQDVPVLPELAAAGSLPRAPALARPSNGRRVRLVAELGLVFIAAPIAVSYAIQGLRVALFLMLAAVLAGFLLYLFYDRSFSLARELSRGFRLRELVSIAAVFLVVGGIVTAWVWLNRPVEFLAFPSYRPELWAAVMILYPLLSALPQELVYRTFFFHRYGPLFRSRRWIAVALNGALFGFAHVIIGNGVAITLSGALGLLLAYRYSRTRSVWAVWIEHTLYGWLAFTVGLGRYFFTGVSMF
jgi:membrane protease YdiL (CAAX protease family)